MSRPSPKRMPELPVTAKRWVRYVLAFGVSAAVGLAPYLGRLHVPLFSPLLDLIPQPLQDATIPPSAALMGVVAIGVQWFGSEKLSLRAMRRWFYWTAVLAIVAIVLLTISYIFFVVPVQIRGGQQTVRFVVGFSRPMRSPCTTEISDSECIKRLTLDQAAVNSFWGDRQVKIAQLCLILSYLTAAVVFGSLIGLLVVRQGYQTVDVHLHRFTHRA